MIVVTLITQNQNRNYYFLKQFNKLIDEIYSEMKLFNYFSSLYLANDM